MVSSTFDEILIQTRAPVLVDFWAPSCEPSRTATFEVERVAATTSGRALVLRVNVDTLPDLAVRYHVQGLRTFVVFERGVPVRQRAGLVRQAELLQLVEPS